MKPRASLASVLLAAGLLAPAHRSALAGCLVEAPPVGAPFVDCSGGQVFNIVPPGENGTYNMADFLRAQAGQGFPPHTRDQEPLYAGLLDVAPNLKDAEIGRATSELQSHVNLVCRLLLEKKKMSDFTRKLILCLAKCPESLS